MSTIPINFTDNAAAKVFELIKDEGNPELKLRVFISGGGCSGFQYGFTFDEVVNEDDLIVEKSIAGKKAIDDEEEEAGGESGGGNIQLVKLLIDAASLQYLAGAEIDYREDANGAQFVIRNPNAKTTCGCGSSFSA